MKKHTIELTSDYKKFINNDEQREHKEDHIQNIKGSMMEFGFIPSQPVAVIPKGAKHLIIDGHSRFDAATQLGIPVWFIILEPKYAEAVAILNIQKAWGAADHVRRFAIKGDPDYMTLSKYVMQGIPLSAAASMLYGQAAGSGNVMKRLSKGEFEVRSTEHISIISQIIQDMGESCPVVKTRHFIDSLSMCLFVQEFDCLRFVEKLKKLTRDFSKTINRQTMLEQIDEIYNYKAAIKIPLAFRAKEEAKKRNAVKR